MCIYDEETDGYVERRVRTELDAFRRALEKHSGARVLLEASTESEWVRQWLEELGFEVIVADPFFRADVRAPHSTLETDRRDTRALCDACRHGTYRAAHRRSAERRQWQAQLRVRESLVRTRTTFISGAAYEFASSETTAGAPREHVAHPLDGELSTSTPFVRLPPESDSCRAARLRRQSSKAARASPPLNEPGAVRNSCLARTPGGGSMRSARHPRMLVLASVLAACGGTPASEPDAGADAASLDATVSDHDGGRMDAGGRDAALEDGATPPPDAGSATDGGADGSAPPVGTTMCGSGTLTPAELTASCVATDPIFDLSIGAEKGCEALVAEGARYEVWCSTTQLYLWIRLSQVDDPTKIECNGSVPLPDGGVLTYSSRIFDWSSYAATENPLAYHPAGGARHLNGSGGTVDWVTSGVTGGVEQPWTVTYEHLAIATGDADFSNGGTGIAAFQQMRADCDDTPIAGSRRILFVAPFEWSAP